jgi:hypothetical protein
MVLRTVSLARNDLARPPGQPPPQPVLNNTIVPITANPKKHIHILFLFMFAPFINDAARNELIDILRSCQEECRVSERLPPYPGDLIFVILRETRGRPKDLRFPFDFAQGKL